MFSDKDGAKVKIRYDKEKDRIVKLEIEWNTILQLMWAFHCIRQQILWPRRRRPVVVTVATQPLTQVYWPHRAHHDALPLNIQPFKP